jgi:hypothetical protein
MAKKKLKPKVLQKKKRRSPTARTTRRKTRGQQAELKHIPWHTIALEDLNPLAAAAIRGGQEIMLARVLLKKGMHRSRAQPPQRATHLHSGRRAEVLDRRQRRS